MKYSLRNGAAATNLLRYGAAIVVCSTLLAHEAAALLPAAKNHNFQPYGATDVISPDGLLLAHFGTEYPPPLYVTNLKTGKNTIVATSSKGPSGWSVVDGLSFSPDGSRLVFEAGPARAYTGSVYMASTDSLDVKVLASSKQRVPDSSDVTGKNLYDIAIDAPAFSPDGKQILVAVTVTDDRRDADGHIDNDHDKIFVGLLSRDKEDQTPRKLTPGNPLFWSIAGTSIFYINEDFHFGEVNVASGRTTALGDARNVTKLGRVPGQNALFVLNPKRTAVTVLTLDGTKVSPDLAALVASISLRDSEGRYLRSVERAGPHEISVSYRDFSGSLRPAPKDKHQLVPFR